MTSTRKQKAKARKSRGMDMMSDFDTLNVMIGNENAVEKELSNTIEESSVHDDIESNMYSRNELEDFTHGNNAPRQNEARENMETSSLSEETHKRVEPKVISRNGLYDSQDAFSI